MIDLEKVIRGLGCIAQRPNNVSCSDCPYFRPFTDDPECGWCDRVVIADDAIALLRELESVKPVADAVVDVIKSQPTVGDCISVKDRLPDGVDCYLAYNRYGWDIMAYDPNEGVWLSMGHRVADGEITHWMPLPAEPPEEVSGDA